MENKIIKKKRTADWIGGGGGGPLLQVDPFLSLIFVILNRI